MQHADLQGDQSAGEANHSEIAVHEMSRWTPAGDETKKRNWYRRRPRRDALQSARCCEKARKRQGRRGREMRKWRVLPGFLETIRLEKERWWNWRSWGGAEKGDKIGRGAGDGCSFPAVAVAVGLPSRFSPSCTFLSCFHSGTIVPFREKNITKLYPFFNITITFCYFVNFGLQYGLQVNYSSYIVNYSLCLRI
jgi:hypothetical protein